MSVATSVGVVKEQVAEFKEPFRCISGAVLPSVELVYETYGQLSPAKDNAILICHALSGDHHAAGISSGEEQEIGWWEKMIGSGKPVDTDKFFVICSNNLGGCNGSTGPASIDSDTGKQYGPEFPSIKVEDWVNAQVLLVDKLGIDCLAAVVGGSIGGMQALSWAIKHPSRIKAAVLVAAAARLTTQNIAFNEIARQAIMRDPNFAAGNYYDSTPPRRGLALARMLGHVTYLSGADMERKFGRQRKDGDVFSVESYLRYQGHKFSDRFDANTYLLMTRALDAYDPAATADGDLAKAVAAVTAQFLVVSFTSDWRFPPERSRELVKALIAAGKSASYLELDAQGGHDAFLLDDENYHSAVAKFLARLI